MVAVTVDGGGRSAHGSGALAGCGSREVGIGGAAVDDGILAAIVSSPADCFYRLSEMASICSGGGMRWRASTVALPPPSRLSLSLHVTDWRKTGGRGDGVRRWWLENDEIIMTFFPQMMKSVPPNDEISSSIGGGIISPK
nr:hypothetical protein Iba_chr15dCG1810 [Ipomoea batatas]